MPATTAFLSHATHDDAFVKSLRQALEAQGVQAWADSRELRPGDILTTEIEKAIGSIDYFFLVFSQHTIQSTWVKRELDYAKAQGKRIIALLLDAQTMGMLAWLFDEEPMAIPVSTAAGGLEHAMPAILTALGQRLPEDAIPMEEAPEPPVNELCLVLAEPKLYTEGGLRRGRARVHFELEPGDGSAKVETHSFDFICPLGPIEAGRMKWYIEDYPQAPFLEKILDRGAALERDLAQWGKLLFDALTDHPDTRELVWTWKGEQVHERRFSVKFNFYDRKDPTPEEQEAMNILLATPWEILHDGQAWLFQGKKPVRIRRRLPNRGKRDTMVLQDKLRVLLLSPRPVDDSAGYIDHRIAPQALLAALEPLGERAELVILSKPTFKDMCAAIRAADEAGRPFSVVHFDGHGVFDANRGLGALCFESSEGEEQTKLSKRKTHIVYADELLAELRGYRIPFFFLDACQSAVAEKDPTASVAATLLQTGVASVAAMSYSVLVSTAAAFAKAFYAALAQGARIGSAMLAGQRALHADPVRAQLPQGEQLRLQDWFVPVLFQERDDPQLVRYLPSKQATDISAQTRIARAGAVPTAPHGGHRFVGRKQELLKLERLLLLEPWAALIGPGGAGKTTLAAELAHWLLRTGRVQRLAFVSFEFIRDVRATLDSLGRQLVAEEFSVATLASEEAAWQQIERSLREYPTLILLDNLESVQPLPGTTVAPAVEDFGGFLAAFRRLLAASPATRLCFTSREVLPPPFDRGRQIHRLGALGKNDALQLIAEVMRTQGIELASLNAEDLEEQFGALARSANYHARALSLLTRSITTADEQGRTELLALRSDYSTLMTELERRHPGERENSLFASLELSLRRLPAAVRERVAVLAVYQGGVDIATWAMVADCEQDDVMEAAMTLVQVGLAELKLDEYPYYFQLDPALPVWLARQASEEQLAVWRPRWREAMVALSKFLYQQQFQNSHLAHDLTLLQEANLLAMLQTLAQEAPPEQVVEVTGRIESLFSTLSRPAVLQWVQGLREQAATQLGAWGHAQFTSQSAQIDRLLEQGNLPAAFALAKAIWEQCESAGAAAYPGAAYDVALAHFRLGRVLKRAGRAEQALPLLQEARRRFEVLGKQGNSSAARMASACLTEMGDCLEGIGQYEAAATHYEAAMTLDEARGDLRDVATGKIQLATVRMQQKDYPEALRLYEEAKAFFVRNREAGSEATAWHQIGLVHQEAGNYPAAERAYQASLRIKTREKNRAGEASSIDQIGILYSLMDRLEDSVLMHEKAAQIRYEIKDIFTEGKSRNNLAFRLLQLHRPADARPQLQRAIECKSQFGHAAAPWTSWAILHQLEGAEGQTEAATAARQKAIQSYAAYRQDGGESRSNRYRLLLATLEALSEGKQADIVAYLKSTMEEGDPEKYTALCEALLALLAGSQEVSLTDDPALHYMDVVDLRLLFFAEG